MLGKTPRILKSGKHQLEFYRTLWKTILAGKVFRTTIINKKKNGELYHAEQTITPVKGFHDRITHFVSVIRDVTDRIGTEEELRCVTAELARSNHELDQFASLIAHDLREPVRTALGFAQLFVPRHQEKLAAEATEFLGYIAADLTRMDQMISGLLELCRVVRAEGRLSRQTAQLLVSRPYRSSVQRSRKVVGSFTTTACQL
ncbi:MAG: PAS domain S-box protein [Planctomycetes bacterium]|nr:PAS domain S-box protein [Planctomycetota bacterium]